MQIAIRADQYTAGNTCRSMQLSADGYAAIDSYGIHVLMRLGCGVNSRMQDHLGPNQDVGSSAGGW